MRYPRPATLLTLCLPTLLALAPTSTGQCADPTIPRGGFATIQLRNRPVTFSDNYKTQADVFHPTVKPGRYGWPMLVSVHGFPGRRQNNAWENAQLAAAGFFVVSYDVRGQGVGVGLNPGRGSKMMSLDEWIDMFEIVEWAIQTYGTSANLLVDARRVGIYGVSQGGMHSWAAAAWSGKKPPTNNRRTKVFPVIAAVVPRHFIPHLHESNFPNGTVFKGAWHRWAYHKGAANVVVDNSVKTIWAGFLNNDDPMGMYGWMRNDPGRDFRNELKTSTTAVLSILSWHDLHQGVNRALVALNSMPKATPRRIYINTGGHGSPANSYQSDVGLTLTRDWFRRFLKGWSEPIEQGPPVFLAALPADAPTYLNSSSLWRLRADAAFPPADARAMKLHLRSGGVLSAQAPGANVQPDIIRHVVPNGYNAQRWHTSGGVQPVSTTLRSLPLSSVSYTGSAFVADTEIACVPRVNLSVSANQAHYLVAARLEAVGPNQGIQILSHGALGVRQTKVAPAKITIEMDAVDTVLPAGYKLRLTIQNHIIVRSGNIQLFRYMPFFNSYNVNIEHRQNALSSLELMVRPRVRIDLSTSTSSINSPMLISYRLRSSALRAGVPYVLACSLSGQTSNFPIAGANQLYLTVDASTSVLYSLANSAVFPGFIGKLDAAGNATASLDARSSGPALPGLFGTTLHIAPVVLQNGALHAGAPLFLKFQ